SLEVVVCYRRDSGGQLFKCVWNVVSGHGQSSQLTRFNPWHRARDILHAEINLTIDDRLQCGWAACVGYDVSIEVVFAPDAFADNVGLMALPESRENDATVSFNEVFKSFKRRICGHGNNERVLRQGSDRSEMVDLVGDILLQH